MRNADLHIAETAGWRALLTHAQLIGGICLTPAVEEHLGRVRVRCDGPVPVVAEITADAQAHLQLRPGARAWVAVKAGEVAVHPA